MEERKPRFACVFPPNFMRGAMAIGASACLFEHGLKPHAIVGCSGGALAALSVAGWDSEVIRRAFITWSSIGPKDIWAYRFADKEFAFSIALGALLQILPDFTKHTHVERSAKAICAAGAPVAALRNIFHQSSFLSNEPLRNLLRSALDFRKITSDSAVKIFMVAAEKMIGQRVVINNTSGLTDEELISGALGSAAIPGIFPPERFRAMELIDGICASEDFIGLDILEAENKVDHVLYFKFYDLPAESVNTAPENIDHSNELRVRDTMKHFIKHVSPDFRSKIVPIELEGPVEKINITRFKSHEIADLVDLGYACTDRKLRELGWIGTNNARRFGAAVPIPPV